ncbi:MAG: hypothetical protein KBG20_06555 [Caldilineaceae bacterium]|nr:hypothetical protein [Caldilineaceae bacterium]MBP8106019.1 hypothetical protein [Caldilineaceae bacterium]MBP8123119.1 hypothetical protein [Caldilineaceae bacterium]MBP9071939.1 hypothetical protein [Caldilineaceae bacterium]
MNGNFGRKAVALVLGLLMVMTSAVSVFAASGPESATAPGDGWVQIQAGESQWYTFHDEGNNNQILVKMNVSGQAGFAVYTPAEVAAWQSGAALTPVGNGSADAYSDADLTWAGNFNQSDDYYVVVSQGDSGTSNYNLSISGATVWFPIPAEAAMTATETATEMTPATDSVTTPAADGPATLQPGEEAVVSFVYDGNSGQILASLDSNPDSAVIFSVWTPTQWQLRSEGQDIAPIGQGSYNAYVAGDLSWSGNFNGAGIYNIIVKNNSSQTATYTLTVTGDGVSQ